MKYILKKLILPIIVVCAPLQTHAWTEKQSCEGPSDQRITEFFSGSFYSTEEFNEGKSSCMLSITQGAEGWGEWGGVMDFPSNLKKGDDLWIKLDIFFPESFDYSASPHLKFMRVHTQSPTRDNHGYMDLYLTPDGATHWDPKTRTQTDKPFYVYYEFDPKQEFLGTFDQDRLRKGQWETFEIYYQFDTVAMDSGGNGRIRIWRNGLLLGDLTNQTTLYTEQSEANAFFLFTYWNGSAPKSQYLFVDNIIMTTETPSKRDEEGFPMIGMEEISNVSLPLAPTNFQAEF